MPLAEAHPALGKCLGHKRIFMNMMIVVQSDFQPPATLLLVLSNERVGGKLRGLCVASFFMKDN